MTDLHIELFTDASSIRSLCIREYWYTNGTCREYDNLLNYCEEHMRVTEETLDFIAWDIFNHSSNFDYSYPAEEIVENIKFIILNGACRVSYLGE